MNRLLLTSFFFLVIIISCGKKDKSTGGISPDQALGTFRLPEGFKIELVAAEPLITDPVAMEVDENGNIYVVQMTGYPLDTTGSGKIKLLTDTNGDGAPDKSTLFADHLRLPTGIMRWKKGVLVVDTPELLYLEDTNGDGHADLKKTVITGMALTNPQHIANTPVYGLDNWIYLAHMGIVTPTVSMEFNDTGSVVRYTANTNAKTLPRNADGRNIRLRPDTYELEMLSGSSQYGQAFDNWGHHFYVENAIHIFYEAIAARYLERNPNLLVESAADYISDHGNASDVYPITVNPENQLLTDRGVVTSACGIIWYNGGLFPDSFNSATFVAEPVSNIVHVDRIRENGASFTASRMYDKKEFLASTDGWFRPVQFYIGPDGALYVIDYYRQIIEHPEWLSEEVINSGALYNGADKGRIYRITPTAAKKMDWCNKIQLGKAGSQELIQALNSNNSWWRRTAQRLLVDRNENDAPGLLKAFADTTQSATGFLHALWTLEGLHALDSSLVRKALKHPEAGVRESAIQLAELHLADFTGIQNELYAMRNDNSPKVRYQLLCTIGNIETPESKAIQQHLLAKDIEDKWVQIAALSSSKENELAVLQQSIKTFASAPSEGKAMFFSNCANVIGLSKKPDDIKKVIELCTNNNSNTAAWWQAACLDGLANAIADKGMPPGNFEKEHAALVSKFSPSTSAALRSAAIRLLSVSGVDKNENLKNAIALASTVAGDSTTATEYRADAIRLLAFDKENDHKNVLAQIISANEGTEIVQRQALITYNKLYPSLTNTLLISNWKNFSASMRESATRIFLSSNDNVKALLDAIQNKTVQTTAISWPAKVQLMQNDDPSLRKRARDLLASEIGSREEAYKKFEPALAIKGNVEKGAAVFKNVCGVCHQYSTQHGNAFGPDLASISNRDKASIMTDILNPNRSIAVKYDLWTVTKKNGELINGIISAETPGAITLKQSGTQSTVISRSDIKSMRIADASAMPVGLENSLTIDQMADLLSFITKK